jgi:metal-responsive CopG/Arc/MetJ family transcriptional regulator
MKTAISIPDGIFERTNRFAHRVKKPRSRVVSDALDEYLARHAPDEVTEAMDRAMKGIGEGTEPLVKAVGRRVLKQVEW